MVYLAEREVMRAGGSLVVGELVLDGLWRSSADDSLIAVRPKAPEAPHCEAQFIASGTTYQLTVDAETGACQLGPWTLSLDRSGADF